MKVDFIYPTDKVASGRYRGAMPAQYLYSNGWKQGKDILVIGKHAWPEDFTKGYKKYIFDVCDDHFNTEWREHYLEHCKNAALVTCNSETMRDVIKVETGRDAFVIPDPFELPRQKPHIGENLLWFGNRWNFKAVERVLPSLDGYSLEVVSSKFHPNVIEWSLDALYKALGRAGMVIIPTSPNKPAKSANRMIEAINGGCFVVAESMPAYDEFKSLMWIGDIREGCDWALSNKSEVIERITEAQKYINKFSMNEIGKLWHEALTWAM